MPVYNEEGSAQYVINEWVEELEKLGINFVIRVYNDGSKDNTKKILNSIAERDSRVVVTHKINTGHGPTILQGYYEAKDAEWIFQVDSDGEMKALHFGELWRERECHDMLIGYRVNRNSPISRSFITFVASKSIKLFFGCGIRDVNCPYRLMRSTALYPHFGLIPNDTLAPNVIVSGICVKNKLRIKEFPIEYTFRTTGEVSIKKLKLIKFAIASLLQTIKFRFKV